MAQKKILVVFGATGAQGGSVIRTILADKKAASDFALRAVTRDTSKPSAKALTERGVECVEVSSNGRADEREFFVSSAYSHKPHHLRPIRPTWRTQRHCEQR